MKPICRSLAFSLATFLVVGTSSAKDTCGAEVKIQLQPSDVTKTISSLDLGGGQDGNVLFYDTDKLSLLRSGVILRIRNGGGDNDLTVKIRPPGDQPLSDPSHGEEDFKCEGDLNNGVQ